MSSIGGCSIEIHYCEIMKQLLSALSWGLLRRIWLFKKWKKFLCFAQMHQLWLWQLLLCFQDISLTMIFNEINMVLQFWIIPHLVFSVLRQCIKCTGKYCDRQIPHEMLNQGCGCWVTSGIRITNFDLLHTVVVD